MSDDRRIEAALDDVARLLADRVGHRHESSTRGRLRHSVLDEAARRGLDVPAYAAALRHEPHALQDLLDRVTVQETAFFRDPGQFEALARDVLPVLHRAGAPVRIWSAGCSNGQEPYSLAIVLAESGITDWQVVATDISTHALERTRTARYRGRELTGLSSVRRQRFGTEVDGDWQVRRELRDRVTAVRHNLSAEVPPFPIGTCQVVFCRNVLIYFNRDDLVHVLDRIRDWLAPDGTLFLGYSESLWQVTDRFDLVRLGDAFAYRLASVTAPAPPQPPKDRPRTGVGADPADVRRARAPDPPKDRPRTRVGADPSGVRRAATPTVASLLATGSAALDRHDHAGAVEAFRQATYVDPDHPVAYLNLGLALEAAGDAVAAVRAYRAGRMALDRCDVAAVEATLEGFRVEELTRLLDRKADAT